MIINLFVIRLCSKVSFCFVLWDRLIYLLYCFFKLSSEFVHIRKTTLITYSDF
uniref:Uncharacterized protein n=1 Tax=Papilio xuthus TaxID=66420 RepID=I4DLR0_PAPXU|nr:unknown unsecreted protein [Papilio xuthus]